MDKTEILATLVFWIIAFLVIGSITLLLIDGDTQKTMGYKMTECYDRFENEIQGLECEEEVKCGIVSRELLNDKYCKDIDYKTSEKRRNA